MSMAFCCSRIMARTLPYCPGRRTFPEFANRAANCIAPVFCKQRRQWKCAVIWISLSIRKIKCARMRICGSIGEDELQLPVILVWVRDPLLEREVLLFANSEIVSDGIDR